MKTTLLALSVALLAATTAVSASPRAQDPATADAPAQAPAQPAAATGDATASADALATANRFLDRFYAGDYEAAREDFDATMRDALDADQLAAVGAQLEGAGPLVSRGTPKVSNMDGYQVLVFPLKHEAAAVDGTVSIDAEGRIAGVFFTPSRGGGD
jgi:uncharacterized protein